ncbi:hypothetical protein ACFZC3_15150 [Streptomyces sp. NPDC007903]|uniref:hypothetical protein n=1 Tax=Streptomyces sp. NPDC007903 TaxID=3364786 RepID=UPI0036EED805
MPADYVRRTKTIIIGLPQGPWLIEPSEFGPPEQVGPIATLQTWDEDEQPVVVEFISFAREALPAYVGEVCRQRDHIADLERRLARALRAGGGDHSAR